MILNLVPATLFMSIGMVSEVEPALVAPSVVSRVIASASVLTGEVCQMTVTSTIGVKRPSQWNARMSYSTDGSRSACVNASRWLIMPIVRPCLGAWLARKFAALTLATPGMFFGMMVGLPGM